MRVLECLDGETDISWVGMKSFFSSVDPMIHLQITSQVYPGIGCEPPVIILNLCNRVKLSTLIKLQYILLPNAA